MAGVDRGRSQHWQMWWLGAQFGSLPTPQHTQPETTTPFSFKNTLFALPPPPLMYTTSLKGLGREMLVFSMVFFQGGSSVICVTFELTLYTDINKLYTQTLDIVASSLLV